MKFEKTRALCELFLNNGIPSFDLAVYHKGVCVLRYMDGTPDPDKKEKITGKEWYNLYSCSKPITVTAALMLWEEGRLGLDDPLARYFPEYASMQVLGEDGTLRPNKNPILIRHLFQMTAGLHYTLRCPSILRLQEETDGVCTTTDVARYLAREPLSFEPGTRYQYSLCHDVLAAVTEKVAGMPFEQWTEARIFRPLGMRDTSFLLPMEDYARVTPLFRYENGSLQRRDPVPTYRFGTAHASGGAGCVSTVEDYIKFAEALRTYRLLKKETLDMLIHTTLPDEVLPSFTLPKHNYGLGMRVPRSADGLQDVGWGGAAGSYFAMDLQKELTIFYAQHVIASPTQAIRSRLYATVLEDLFGIKTELPPLDPDTYRLTY